VSGCPECGARHDEVAGSCADRFAALLALDHSRREPWGSRHALAFACYTLQHPAGAPRERLERCWLVLHRILIEGDDPLRLAAALRKNPPQRPGNWNAPPLPPGPAPGERYAVTIADLGDFDAAGYPASLTAWAAATYRRWRGRTGEPAPR
jgi:uncharacterized protein DUF5946